MKQYRNIAEDVAEPVNIRGVRATYENEVYGDHPRNTFDIWIAASDEPSPLVIYIHGGGFTGGDKSRYYESSDLLRFLDAGVSVATINYRFMSDPPYGILASLNDSKRCLQYIRYHAAKYHVDKTRIACSGGSAGAGTALWLAFSDEMADPENPDPVLRESSRITCAGAFATQATYDIYQWDRIIGLSQKKSPEQLLNIARVFGFNSTEFAGSPQEQSVREKLDFLSKMNTQSSPFFVYNKQAGGIPTTEDELNHHPLHAKALRDKAFLLGVDAVVYAPEIGITDPSGKDLVSFFLEKFYPSK